MSLLLSHRRVRCQTIFGSTFGANQLLDKFTGQSIESVRGNATRFEFGFFDTEGVPIDLSDVESMNLKIQPSQTVDGALANKTILAAALDLTLDATSWADDSKSHAVFDLSNAEMNLAITTIKQNFWLVVTAITTAGNEVTLTGGQFYLHEDNNGSLAEPPENPGTYLTLEQGDARYGASSGEGPPSLPVERLLVSGSGSAAANGYYIEDADPFPGTEGMRYGWHMETDASQAIIPVFAGFDGWEIGADDESWIALYQTDPEAATLAAPELMTFYAALGAAPAPTVSRIPAQTLALGQLYRDELTGIWYKWSGTAWQEEGGAIGAADILALLGVPTYADLTAANTALTIGKPFFNTALSKLDITTA